MAPIGDIILAFVGMGGLRTLFELDLSRLYTFEMEVVDAFTWFRAACKLNLDEL